MFRDKSLNDIVIIDFGISDIYRKNESTQIKGISYAYSPPEMNFHNV